MFPNSLKLTSTKHLLKKDRKNFKEDYRPISILPALSKIFERIMFIQISPFCHCLLKIPTQILERQSTFLFENIRKMEKMC